MDKCQVWSPCVLNQIDNRVQRNSVDGLKVLGAPVGTDAHCENTKRKRVDKIASMLGILDLLHDAHAAYGILGFCLGSPKTVYSLRTSTPNSAIL